MLFYLESPAIRKALADFRQASFEAKKAENRTKRKVKKEEQKALNTFHPHPHQTPFQGCKE